MKSSNIDKRNDLSALLMQLPEKVGLFVRKDPAAITAWIEWLGSAEAVMKGYDMPECSRLAGLRANILSAQMAVSAAGKRRQVTERCLASINVAQEVVTAPYEAVNAKLEGVHTFFREIIIPMRNTGLITLDGVTDMTETINTLLRQLSLNEQLSSSINGAIASIGKADVMRTIAQVLTEEI